MKLLLVADDGEAARAHRPATRRVLSIPEDEYIVAGMALGYADEDHPVNGVVAPREPLDLIAMFHG